VLAAASLSACAGGVPTGSSQPFLYPLRITVQDLAVDPREVQAGMQSTIRFRLVRAGDDGSPIYWTAHLVERPPAGGALSASSGGPVDSGGVVETVYETDRATVAFVTLYPSSTPGMPTGDGSGDWKSFSVRVR
jgi:hypothetical protein